MFEEGFPYELQDKVHKVLGKMSLRTYNNILRGVSEECTKEEYILLDGSTISFPYRMYPQFKLYLIKEFERLKKEEQALLGWSAKRELAKINYHIHTDAIKTNLIPIELTPQQTSVIYASEADVLNMALFGMTAKQWRENYPDKKGNIRDYASINELICLSNMENINAVLIEDGLSQKERLIKLNKIAIHQMSILETQTTTVLK